MCILVYCTSYKKKYNKNNEAIFKETLQVYLQGPGKKPPVPSKGGYK